MPAITDDMRDITSLVNRSGIYFLFHNGECVYIGQTFSVMERIAKHKRMGKIAFDRVYFTPYSLRELDYEEREAIAMWKPKLNKLNGRSPVTDPRLNKLSLEELSELSHAPARQITKM